MASYFMRFPGDKPKALTLSYDDNVCADVRLVEIMKKHGLKGTFNINSGQYSPEGSVGDVLHCGHRRLTLRESQELHRDGTMEIACHGVTHPFLEQLPEPLCVKEVYEDRLNLERNYGRMVRGIAYPFGTSSDRVVEILKGCGICYARDAEATEKFDLPTDWYHWKGTCRHSSPRLMELAKRFAEDKRHWSPMLFYLFGHSYEFEDSGSWHIIEEFAAYMGGRDDIWYATNIEIYDYVQAFRRLVFSADGRTAYNPSGTTLFIRTGRGHFAVRPGEYQSI